MLFHRRCIGPQAGEQLKRANRLTDCHGAAVDCGATSGPGCLQQFRLNRKVDNLGDPHGSSQQRIG